MPLEHRETKRREHFKRMQSDFVIAFHKTSPALSKKRRGELAAIAAGYAPATASQAGARLLSKPHIMAAILEAHPRGKLERAGLDATWMLNELADLWDLPLTELFDEKGRLLDIRDMPPGAQKLIAGFEIEERVVQSNGRRHVTTRTGKIKLIDRLAVLEKIGRHHMVSAYQSPEQRENESTLVRALTRALTKNVPDARRELDITPVQTAPRRLADVLGAQDDGTSDAEGSE